MRHTEAATKTEATEGVVSSPPLVKPLARPSAPKAKEARLLSEIEIKRNALWDAFNTLKQPTAAQMDDLLGNLLALPPDATDWAGVVHVFASHDHHELQVLRRDMEEEIDAEAARRAAMTICGPEPRSEWTRADFELLQGDISESDKAWQDCLRLYDTLMRVARESWQSESFPPGCGFRGLYKVLESAYDARDRTRAKPQKESRWSNLLDYLNPAGLDERLARSCQGILGVNVPRARLILEAHELLLRFAERHQLVSAGDAAATQLELIRLRSVLDT